MIRTKPIADVLTASRFLLGASLAWLGLQDGEETLPLAVSFLLTSWITDVLDGPLARRDPARTVTWLGEHDLTADLMVAGGAWVYLGLSGFLSPVVMWGYILLAALALWRTRSLYVGWGVQPIPYAAMIWTAYLYARMYAWLLMLWIALVVVVTWPRLPQKAVEFIQGIGALFRPSNR